MHEQELEPGLEAMLTDERHGVILDRLATEGRVLAASLAAEFGVSEDTVRRDLRDLARAGACRRVYGGALPLTTAPEPGPERTRAGIAAPEKAALARAATALIAPGQTILIDAGTTNTAIATAIATGIPAGFGLTIATNSLSVAGALASREDIRLVVLGGTHDASRGACLGADTIDAIRRLRADLFFLGPCAIDADLGITAFDPAETDVKRAMAEASLGLAVAATTDKLATAAPFRVAPPEAITHLVVSGDAPEETLAAFAAHGTVLHHAG